MNFVNRLSGMGPVIGSGLAVVLGGGALSYGVYNSLFIVEGGQRGVLFNRLDGVKRQVYGEGMHFAVPWFEWPTIYDIRTKPKKVSSSTGTRDLQTINISLRVLYRPDSTHLPQLHSRFGPQYDECILPSILNETLKGVIVGSLVLSVEVNVC